MLPHLFKTQLKMVLSARRYANFVCEMALMATAVMQGLELRIAFCVAGVVCRGVIAAPHYLPLTSALKSQLCLRVEQCIWSVRQPIGGLSSPVWR